MSALYGLNRLNFSHIDLFEWAEKKKIFIPANFLVNDDMKECFLKILMCHDRFTKVSPSEEQARYIKAIKQAHKYLPSEGGLSDNQVILRGVGPVIFLLIIEFAAKRLLARL